MKHRLLSKPSLTASAVLLFGAIVAYAAGHEPTKTGETVTIPQEAGTYFDMNCAVITGSGNVEDAEAEGNVIGSTGDGTVVTFNIDNPVEQAYNFTLSTGHRDTAEMTITLYNEDQEAVYTTKRAIDNTTSWARTQTTTHFINTLPVGKYTLELKSVNTGTGSYSKYCGNWGKMAFYAAEADNCNFSIPGTLALSSSDANIVGSDVRVGDDMLDYVKNGGTLTFNGVHVHQAGAYKVVIPIDYSYGTGTLKIQVIDNETETIEAYYNGVLTKNNSSYEEIDFELTGVINEGTKNVVFTFEDQERTYVCNAKSPKFVRTGDGSDSDADDCHFHIPGTLEFITGDAAVTFSTTGSTVPRYQGSTGDVNVGYVKDGGVMKFSDVVCHKAGVYQITMGIAKYDGGIINFQVIDKATDAVEADFDYAIPDKSNYDPDTFTLGGQLTEGTKDIILTFKSSSTGWVVNLKQPTFEWIGEKYAEIKSIEVVGQEVTAGESTDWEVMLPGNFESETITLKPAFTNGTVELTAKSGDDDVTVTKGADGTFSLPAPEPNGIYIVTATLTPEQGVFSTQTVYTLRIFRIGDLTITDVLIDGISVDAAVVASLNEDAGTAAITDNVYTTIPEVTAKFIDNTEITASAGELSDGNITYTFTGTLAEKDKDYALTIGAFHLYTKADDEESVSVKHNGGTQDGSEWSNTDGYALSYVSDGYNANFRIWKSGESTISVPGDIVVKQLIFKNISNDYSSPEARIWTVTSEGATAVWLPTNSFYDNGKSYDLIVNIEGHKAGAPITFTFGDGKGDGGRLTFELEFTVAHQALTTAPELRSQNVIMPANANHFVAKVVFDRQMKDAEIEFNGAKVSARGNSTELFFPVWNLEYDTDYTFAIPANTLSDIYGNVYDQAISIPVKTEAKATVDAAVYDHVVSTVDEWKAALAAVNASNASADADPVVIFVRNGDYDFGGEEQRFSTYNVSVIGESRDGVILHGTRDGISNPVISTRYAHNMYLQDLTLRNDLDWGKERGGVGVALYSGDHEVGVNLALQSQQDTQVTGQSGYYVNCDIYGAVDYICGGGNQFYDHCNLLMTNEGAITAPSTAPSDIYGYVFQHCTISAYNNSITDGGYNLGRPWQNEPRANYLNTTMEIKPTDLGWGNMADLTTHFYEYNSMDVSGNALDLSVRGNSPSHTGEAYKPVLTDEEAARFTVENVLGEKDSYLATEIAAQCAAPAAASAKSQDATSLPAIQWAAVEGARCYVIYKDGAYLTNVAGTSYQPEETGSYIVRAANARGGQGEASSAVTVSDPSGIDAIGANAAVVTDVEYYNVQGARIDASSTGLRIRVERLADGTSRVVKEIAK